MELPIIRKNTGENVNKTEKKQLSSTCLRYSGEMVKIKDRKSNSKGFKFNWEGALSELNQQYSAVDLQHQALRWR